EGRFLREAVWTGHQSGAGSEGETSLSVETDLAANYANFANCLWRNRRNSRPGLLTPMRESHGAAGAGLGAVACDIVHEFHRQSCLEHDSGNGNPVFDLRCTRSKHLVRNS